MIEVECSWCHKRFAVPDEFAGRKGKCKDCGAAIAIPPAFVATVDPESTPEAPPSRPIVRPTGRWPVLEPRTAPKPAPAPVAGAVVVAVPGADGVVHVHHYHPAPAPAPAAGSSILRVLFLTVGILALPVLLVIGGVVGAVVGMGFILLVAMAR